MDPINAEKGSQDSELKKKNAPSTKRMLPFYIFTFIVSQGLYALGCCVAWTSPALPDLEEKQPFDKELTTNETSWIASSVTLGAVFCGPAAGLLMDYFGRRRSFQILSLPLIVGWTMIAFAPSVWVMSIGRFLTGVSIGGLVQVSVCYMAETSEERIRGFIMALAGTSMSFGTFLTYVFGTFASWFAIALINLGTSILFLILVSTIPESPVHLAHKGDVDAAGKSLMRLRGTKNFEDISEELDLLIAYTRPPPKNGSDENIELIKSRDSLWTRLTRRGTMKAICLSFFLMIFQQFSGLNAVTFFTADIFKAANTNMDPNVSALIIGADGVISTVLSSFTIDRLGRRKLLVISLLGDAICHVGLAVFFFLQRRNGGEGPDGLGWLPFASLILFMLTNDFGIGPLAWFLMGEMIPTDVKGVATAALTSFNWLLAFAVTKSFEDVSNQIGTDACFWFFAAVCVFGAVFCVLFMPETKGKSLDEIQKEYFNAK